MSAEQTPIDFSRRFIAEEFTPLFHTPAYSSLPRTARLRYNQLHALYFNEQVAFFEQEMLGPMLLALMRGPLPDSLRAGLRAFFDEERRHTEMFRSLNWKCAPEFYQRDASYFVQLAQPVRAVLRKMVERSRLFPLLLWLALLQEERSLHFSKGCLADAANLEPHFLAMHRAHLADEVGHVRWDEELLDTLWPQTSRAMRFVNARLLAWMLGEFFHLPKRSGLRVVEQLAWEFRELDAAALRRAMRELERNPAYPLTLYSREITPRAFARFDRYSEFALLGRTLPGYRPARSFA